MDRAAIAGARSRLRRSSSSVLSKGVPWVLILKKEPSATSALRVTRLTVLMAFDLGEDGELVPAFEAREMPSPERAVRAAREMTNRHAGVIAWTRDADPAAGEYGYRGRFPGAPWLLRNRVFVEFAQCAADRRTRIRGRRLPRARRVHCHFVPRHRFLHHGPVDRL